MAQKVFNVGVVGYGLSAKIFHLPFITTTPTFKLHSILQRNPQPTSSAPQDHPNLKHFRTYEPFLADAALDVVILTTTPDTHYALAHQALTAGKHVMVEKPFVPTSSEADALIALARTKQLSICVYQNRRWDADFQTVQALLLAPTDTETGPLGRVYELETHFDRYKASKPQGTWKGELGIERGGSALYDLGTHLVDQVYVLFGMPRAVFAKLVNQREGRVLSARDSGVEPDAVNMQLFYDDDDKHGGLIVHVRIGVLSVEKQQARFWIRGTKGSYSKRGLDAQEDQLKEGMETSDARFGREGEEWAGKLVTVGEDGVITEQSWPNVEPPVTYGRIYELFGDALNGKGRVPVPAEEARDVLLILEAARKSALTGCEVAVA